MTIFLLARANNKNVKKDGIGPGYYFPMAESWCPGPGCAELTILYARAKSPEQK